MGKGTPRRTTGGWTPVEVARAAVAGTGGGDGGWGFAADALRCTVRPPGHRVRARGRRIHVRVGAGRDSARAARVLAGVARIAAADPCAFTVTADCGEITLHPDDDAHYIRLVQALHGAAERLSGLGPDPGPGPEVELTPGPVLIGPRHWRADPGRGYVLTATVRHGPAGSVHLGRSTATGADVVVKQALGRSAREALRHEAELLRRLDGSGLTPRPLELVRQADRLLLVQERIPGRPLGAWVAARLTRDGAPDVPWEAARPMAAALVDLVERLHAHDLVLRGLTPENVMVRPDGGLRLVNLRPAAATGSVVRCAGTPGYLPPEDRRPRRGLRSARPGDLPAGSCLAQPAGDLFALGGLFFLLATGHDPLLPDGPGPRPAEDRLARWLALAARTGRTARRLAPAVLGLRRSDPGERMGLGEVRRLLCDGTPRPSSAAPPPAHHPAAPDRIPRDGSHAAHHPHPTRAATP
ncbi:protein kinase domain-containing protein [Peterkaempfera bronchialis]|uniref:protein kinase domain-containing protein n=1 Tax=Peterkaempfera bronchialis TaxID=2126346 RepID=UPI003C304627